MIYVARPALSPRHRKVCAFILQVVVLVAIVIVTRGRVDRRELASTALSAFARAIG